MKHLLGIEHLTKEELQQIISLSFELKEISERDIKKVPTLRGKTIVNLFFENSTRTRSSFEIAGKWLSADVINFSASSSSTSKGETFLDTALTLQAMAPDVLVVRHKNSGVAEFLARELSWTRLINAGDGTHEHPTQAILDAVTMIEYCREHGKSESGNVVVIVGDILHSRVARSNIFAQALLGNKVRLVGPPTLVPKDLEQAFAEHCVEVHHNLEAGLRGADFVMCLRMQLERQGGYFVSSLDEYSQFYGVSESLLARVAPGACILHPGPVNRGVEVSSEIVDGPRSLVARQVRYGVVVRMACLYWLLATPHAAVENKGAAHVS